eukprot:c1393_g1_i1 orf=632-1195(+)
MTSIRHRIVTKLGKLVERVTNSDFSRNKCNKACSEWWDNQYMKTYSRFLHSKHRIMKESLWIYNGYTPCWDQEKLQRRGLHSLVEVENGDLSAGRKVKACRNRAEEEVEGQKVSIISNGNCVNTVEDTSGPIALIALLQACVKHRDLDRGSEIHNAIVRRGLLENIFIGSTLVSMYAKCGILAKARE